MAKPDRELLRPEDATSLEEFQARRIAEQMQLRAINSSWKDIGRILLSSLMAFAAIFCWAGVATIHDAARWFFLVLALIFTVLVVRIFGRIELRGVRGSKRYMQLNQLSKQWQARARRGEIPETTPGGPKVWRDELESEQRNT
jgi:hypothetical protein